MTTASLITDGSRPVVRLVRLLPDPPPVVWRALTEPDRLAEWFPCGVEVEGGRWLEGATIRFPFDPVDIEMTLAGRVLEVREPEVLAYTWGDEVLRFELRASEDGGTELTLLDELAPGAAARNAAGWEVCLDRLTGRVPPVGGWPAEFARYSAAFEPVIGPQEGPPAGHRQSSPDA